MRPEKLSAEARKRVEACRRTGEAWGRWCTANARWSVFLYDLARGEFLDRLIASGKTKEEFLVHMESFLAPATEAAAARQKLLDAQAQARCCWFCGGPARDNVSPPMCYGCDGD